jgi:hypothetical protein
MAIANLRILDSFNKVTGDTTDQVTLAIRNNPRAEL